MGSKRRKDRDDETPTTASSSSSSGSDESEPHSKRHKREGKEHRKSDSSYKREKRRRKEKEEMRRRKEKREREKERKRRKSKTKYKKEKTKRDYDSDSSSGSESESSGSDSETKRTRLEPRVAVQEMLKEFPNVGSDLKQLLQMIDDGQAVDIKGISEKTLEIHLKKLFLSLSLKENGDRVFLLPPNARPTLDVVEPLIKAQAGSGEPKSEDDVPAKDRSSAGKSEGLGAADKSNMESCPTGEFAVPRRRVIGPEMPSAELLSAAAKLTEAQEKLREVELEEDSEYFIGPPPPAVVAEAASSNEAERFEEVTRIMEAEADSPYDILGVNHKMPVENVKKRYWKLSLLVHPDKCSHPQANQAFILLNKAFKELQDPEKRNALNEKIKQKEEQEAFKVELRAMREAALWRRSQGISMDGDEELLADIEVKVAPKRDEWMTTLPPERKPGVTMQSTQFSRRDREGRGDASAWTDTPSDRAEKAKMNYLQAYNEAAALASNEEQKLQRSVDAELVDKYNKEKRSKSLVEKHREESSSRAKKKSKQQSGEKETEWSGQHPWKPWDREKDLTAGRQSVKLDPDNMAQNLSSRFSSGNFQRSFL